MLSQEVNDYEKSTLQYFNEISNIKPLDRETENELFHRFKDNGDLVARDIILSSNLKFVVTVAKKYKGRGLPFADLVAEGNMGLTRALKEFDPDRGYKFISYAVWWINQAILEALKKRNNLSAEELPGDHENYDDFDDDYSTVTLNETFIDNEYNKEKDNDIRMALNLLSEDLNEREKEILIQYYGLDGSEPKTLEEIGQQYNLTKERVRQINEKTLKKMRSKALTNFITSDIYR